MANRIDRVNSLLRRELGKILLKDFDFSGTMITLTRVETTANLIEAKIFISVFPERKAGMVLETLNENIYDIQRKINKKLNMRPIPRIIFIKDENISQAAKIEEILEGLKNKKK